MNHKQQGEWVKVEVVQWYLMYSNLISQRNMFISEGYFFTYSVVVVCTAYVEKNKAFYVLNDTSYHVIVSAYHCKKFVVYNGKIRKQINAS